MHPTFKHAALVKKPHGFTLIELIVVIVITSILAVGAAQFIANPTASYFDMESRANLTDRADGTLRTMARNIRNALPNSIRVISGSDVTTDNSLLEFIPVKSAGRYRESKGVSADDPLDFTASNDTFDILGPTITIQAGDQLVIYNTSDTGLNAYENGTNNRRALNTGVDLSSLTFSGDPFTYGSPGKRFYVVATPVTYACDMTAKTLVMYSNYAIATTQPASISALDALSNVRKSILAENLTSCRFDYATGLTQQNSIVNITLAMTENGANLRLMHQVNVVNSP